MVCARTNLNKGDSLSYYVEHFHVISPSRQIRHSTGMCVCARFVCVCVCVCVCVGVGLLALSPMYAVCLYSRVCGH